ncbi:MAG: hypothetical protein MZV70_35075 [Desulfobacterales bacterium]|nr:hypothetical protein [Desulfobacterales bacterium]
MTKVMASAHADGVVHAGGHGQGGAEADHQHEQGVLLHESLGEEVQEALHLLASRADRSR